MSSKNEVRLLALTEVGKENVNAVCELLTEQNLKCSWIDINDVKNIHQNEEDVIYVIDPTEGKEVEHLVNIGCSVIGPQCALTVLKHNILLKNDLQYPVHNLTMLNCLICFSNVEPSQRLVLRKRVEYMGGRVTGSLTQDVTHLIVKEVGSIKYYSAAHAGIPIMTIGWIDHLWRHGQSRYISAKESNWEEFKCPIFLGCSVCVTGYSTTERNRIQNLVTKNGGVYSGAMKLDFTTHLVVNRPEGQKYAMASKFGVKIVNTDWVYKSIEKGSCQDCSRFPVLKSSYVSPSKPNSSTPDKAKQATKMPVLNDMSNISIMTVNETTTSLTDVSHLSTIGITTFPINKLEKKDLLSFSMVSSVEQILDGISVYIIGFNMKEEEKLHQLLSTAGATRCNKLTSLVTHVLVGSLSISENYKSLIQNAVKQSNKDLWVVFYSWLLDSLLNGKVLPELNYWVDDLVERPENKQMNIDVFEEEDSTVIQQNKSSQIKKLQTAVNNISDETVLNNIKDVVSQYMTTDDVGDTTLLRNFDTNILNEQKGVTCEKDETTLDLSLNDNTNERTTVDLFGGLNFIVMGFDEEEDINRCVNNIKSLGGHVLPSYSKKVADYAVLPIIGSITDKTAHNIVTDFWVDSCLDEGCILSINDHPMSTPFVIPNNTTPLKGCVTCLSKYQEPLRSHLVYLMRELGAVYQENVVRKDIPPMLKTTHLIVMVPEGDKYLGSKKWGIHTVTSEWIYECARQGKKVSESIYDVASVSVVDKLTLPNIKLKENEYTIEPPVDATNSKTETIEEPVATEENKDCKNEFPPMPRGPSAVDHICRRLEGKDKKTLCSSSSTPLKEKVLRMMDTPNKFLKADQNISFQLDEVFALLKTPLHEQERIKIAVAGRTETPLSSYVERFLKDTVKQLPGAEDDLAKNLEKMFETCGNSKDNDQENKIYKEKVDVDKDEEITTLKENSFQNNDQVVKNPLVGVVLYVCKKLTKQRMEFSTIINDLGGDFRWTYDKACTHFMFQGKTNDMNREFRMARSEGKIIVSPHWLYSCKEAEDRVAEKDFPYDYNPNKSIKIVPTSSPKQKRITRSSQQYPLRSTRTTTRSQSLAGIVSSSSTKDKDSATSVKDSQEERESLRKTLETIISSTSKVTKTGQIRRSRNSEYASPPHLMLPSKDNLETAKFQQSSEKPESSQDVHVTWDDPIGREEMEKIMRQENGGLDVADNNTASHTSEQNCSTTIVHKDEKPSFLISSVTPEEKIEFASIIEKLGGSYLDRDYFDINATHLIVKKPVRNEKFLASLASGKWILHTSYMGACVEAGIFVKEDLYEYGNPSAEWTPSNNTESLLSAAAHRWRLLLSHKKGDNGQSMGAFADWRVLLLVSARHTPGFVRLLKSGSGEVISSSLPFQGNASDLTHAIIDPNRLKEISKDTVLSFHKSGVHCCVPEYIAEFLMKDPIPKVEDSYLPMLKETCESDDGQSSRKRRKIN